MLVDGFGIISGGIMAERVDNEYPPEATIGDQRLRKDRGKIAEAVSILSVSAAKLPQIRFTTGLSSIPSQKEIS
jgi:hypothetical protein